MIYAPVIIPTLNRYSHLLKCIKSLQKNPYARFTDLYISVDFPPNSTYVEGNKKIVSFLQSGINGFNNVYIYYQKDNLGAYDNLEFLHQKAFEKYDRVIVLEDDNEVSCNFIEYCDKGLELFENDERVFALNGSNYVWCGRGFRHKQNIDALSDYNVMLRQLLWHGSAYWKKSYDTICRFCADSFLSIGKDSKKMHFLLKRSRSFFYAYIRDVLLSQKTKLPWFKGRIVPIDFSFDIFMLLYDYYVIFPINGMVKDNGLDGSGLNLSASVYAMEVCRNEIDQSQHFNFLIGNSPIIDSTEIELHDKYSTPNLFKRFFFRVGLYLYQIGIIKI